MNKSKYLDFKIIKKHARELRLEMTDAEIVLWEQLKNRKLSGYKFLRQHPIVYKADFYCHEKKAVIELDGPIHEEQEEYDQFRDFEMGEKGIHVLRLNNDELANMDIVLVKIKSFLEHVD